MDQEGFIIVDDQGGEHEFPIGFDKTKAIAIVKEQAGPAESSIPPSVRARVGMKMASPGSLLGDVMSSAPAPEPSSFEGPVEPSWWESIKDKGSEMLQHLIPALDMAAEPKSTGDFLNLAIPEMSGAIGATAHSAAGPVESGGKILESIGKSRPMRTLERYGPIETLITGDVKGAAASVLPSATRGTGRILQKAGNALRKAPEAVADEMRAAPEASAPKTLEESMGLAGTEADEMRPQPQSEESVVNYTEPTSSSAEPEVEDVIGHMPDDATAAVESAMESQGMPLGKPRILSWKSGHGPSDELVGTMRDAEGSKEAARRLGLSQKQVVAKTPAGPRQLPTAVQDRMRASIEGMTPEERLQYLANAPNGLTEAFIRSQLP